MGQYTSIILSCLVFLIGLFLSRAIFTALGTALLFLFLTILFELAWDFRKLPWVSILIRPARNLLIIAILSLSFYSLFFLPLEFQITENWKLTPKISSVFGLVFLVFWVIILNLVNWNKLLKMKLPRFLLLIFVVICGLVYREYRQEKLVREYLPKIYKISPNWGIQASVIRIQGVNFFPVWEKGRVMLNNEEMVIKSWNEKLITAEQGVPAKFGPVGLYVKRSDGIISNSVPFEIRNPDSLGNYKE